MSAEWRHRPTTRNVAGPGWTDVPPYCVQCRDDWPCDAERMRVERDAAIRRAGELEAALRSLMQSADDYERLARAANFWDDGPVEAVVRGIQQHRAALRSQESQKPPETAR